MTYQIRPGTPADFEQIVALTNSQISEPIAVADLLRGEELRKPEHPICRLVAVDEAGALLGSGVSSQGPGSRPGEFSLRVRVWQQHQRKGIARTLYTMLEGFVREKGGLTIESGVRDDDPGSIAWSERRGFKIKYHLFESTLELHAWDPTPFLGAVEQARAAGIHFTPLADLGDGEELLRRYYEFSMGLAHDIPGMEDRPRISWEDWIHYLQGDPYWDPNLVLLAVDGERWAGLTQISKQPSGGYYNNFTAVSREYRGKGLSLAIKVATLLRAKELGAPYIRTNNHSVNQPMLATNQRLGYKPLPGFLQIGKSL